MAIFPYLCDAGHSNGRRVALSDQHVGLVFDSDAMPEDILVCEQGEGVHDSEEEVALIRGSATQETIAACVVVGDFCSSWTQTRIEPTLEELEVLSQRCACFNADSLCAALSSQLVVVCSDGQDVEWQRHWRAMHAINFFYFNGGTSWIAAQKTVRNSEDLVRYLALEIPQCRSEATQALCMLDGHCSNAVRDCEASAEEMPPNSPAAASSSLDLYFDGLEVVTHYLEEQV